MGISHTPTAEAFELIFTHCNIAQEVAAQLLERSGAANIDRELLRAGCLLHDIGVYRLYDNEGRLNHKEYIKHGILGYELLKVEGFDEVIYRFCSCHTGVGLTREDIQTQHLPLPIADYVAKSAEECLLMYADKFHTKTNPPKFMTASAYSQDIRRFGDDKVEKFKLLTEEFGEPALDALASKYKSTVIA